MRTFKQHLNLDENAMHPTTVGVGTTNQVSIEDGSMGPHNIHEPAVLEKVNSFLAANINMKEFLVAQHAMDQVRNDLAKIGLTVPVTELSGDKGTTTLEVKFGGGRFGKDVDGADIDDDGISHRKEGGLKLEVSFEKISSGSSKVYAKLV